MAIKLKRNKRGRVIAKAKTVKVTQARLRRIQAELRRK